MQQFPFLCRSKDVIIHVDDDIEDDELKTIFINYFMLVYLQNCQQTKCFQISALS